MVVLDGRVANYEVCSHRGVHGTWIGRGGRRYAVCAMPRPYLRACIRMLQRRVNDAYPALAIPSDKRHQAALQSLGEDEATLGMLRAEEERRSIPR
jgi:hypothetical protein